MNQEKYFNDYNFRPIIDRIMKEFKINDLNPNYIRHLQELKTLSASTNLACRSLGINNEILLNRELIDVKDDNYDENDYLEGLMVLICSIKDSFCDLIDGLNNITNE